MTENHQDKASSDSELTASQVAAYLRGLVPGQMDVELFRAIAGVVVLGSVEMVVLRQLPAGKLQVLLTQRPEGDPWAGLWHAPGTIMRRTDPVSDGHDYAAAFERIFSADGELKGSVKLVGKPVYVDSERRKTLRGDEFAAIHYAEVTGEPAVGKFFDVADFPGNIPEPGIVDHQINFILLAAKQFAADR